MLARNNWANPCCPTDPSKLETKAKTNNFTYIHIYIYIYILRVRIVIYCSITSTDENLALEERSITFCCI